MILELKHVKTESEMPHALQEASSQLIKKKYDSRLIYHGYQECLHYGMAFRDKRVMIAGV